MLSFIRKFILIMTLAFALNSAAGAAEPPKKLMVFGDSLTAGYGLPRGEAFPVKLQERLKQEGAEVEVLGQGVSGDTTAGGLSRIEYALKKNPDYVILELGGNDMLRAIDPAVTRANLTKMLEILKARKIPVLLAGMRVYGNLGPNVDAAYVKMYKELAEKYDCVLYPFFLDGVVADRALNLDDGIHPNEKGIAVIVDRILPAVAELLDKPPAPQTKSE
ncbi:MAG: arylesterase [Alphaproteobacteria bacterium]|nr:arylesterase [Alphaproteobacteria bacterium]